VTERERPRLAAHKQQHWCGRQGGARGELGALARDEAAVEAGGEDDARLEELFPDLEAELGREEREAGECVEGCSAGGGGESGGGGGETVGDDLEFEPEFGLFVVPRVPGFEHRLGLLGIRRYAGGEVMEWFWWFVV